MISTPNFIGVKGPSLKQQTLSFVNNNQGVWLEPPGGVQLGPELVTNGDFSNGLTGWSALNWTVNSGALTASSAGTNDTVVQSGVVSLGKTYLLTFTCTVSSGSFNFQSSSAGYTLSIVSVSGTYSQLIIPTASGTNLGIRPVSTFTGSIDNISVKEAVYTLPTTVAYQDNTGVTPVTAPTQTVGLLLDQSQGMVLGPELVTNGTFDTDTTGWIAGTAASLSVENGKLKVTATATNSSVRGGQNIATVVGKTYIVTSDNNSASLRDGTFPFGMGSLQGHIIIAVSSTTAVYVSANLTVGQSATFDNISVRQVLGNHAYQATAANRPTYQLDSKSLPLIRHDGTDYLTVSLPAINVRRNLLTWSEQFDNAAWVLVALGSGKLPVVTPNFSIAPNNKLEGCRLILDAGPNALGDISAFSQATSLATNVYNTSVYMKSNTGSNYIVNLVLGVDNLDQPLNATVTPNWTRFSTTGTSGTLNFIRIRLRGGTGSSAYADISIHHPQLELGSVATDYQKVTNWTSEAYASSGSVYFATPQGMSALHNQSIGTTYNLPALSTDVYAWCVLPNRLNTAQEAQLERYMLIKSGLIEPDYLWEVFRRNLLNNTSRLLTYSSGWTPSPAATATEAVAELLAGGSTGGSSLTAGDAVASVYTQELVKNAVGAFTFSVNAKRKTSNYIVITFGGTLTGRALAVFDVTNGAVGQTQSQNGYTLVGASTSQKNNGWYRCTITGNITTASPLSLVSISLCAYLTGNTIGNYGIISNNTIGNSVYLSDLQLEFGTTATSYQRINAGPDPYEIVQENLLMDNDEFILRG